MILLEIKYKVTKIPLIIWIALKIKHSKKIAGSFLVMPVVAATTLKT